MERTHTLRIGGMTCGGCVRAVRSALESIPGLEIKRLPLSEPAVLRFDPARVDPETIVSAVEEAGFTAEFAPDEVPQPEGH
jgi:copper chaperone